MIEVRRAFAEVFDWMYTLGTFRINSAIRDIPSYRSSLNMPIPHKHGLLQNYGLTLRSDK